MLTLPGFQFRFFGSTRKDSIRMSFLKFAIVFHQFPGVMADGR